MRYSRTRGLGTSVQLRRGSRLVSREDSVVGHREGGCVTTFGTGEVSLAPTRQTSRLGVPTVQAGDVVRTRRQEVGAGRWGRVTRRPRGVTFLPGGLGPQPGPEPPPPSPPTTSTSSTPPSGVRVHRSLAPAKTSNGPCVSSIPPRPLLPPPPVLSWKPFLRLTTQVRLETVGPLTKRQDPVSSILMTFKEGRRPSPLQGTTLDSGQNDPVGSWYYGRDHRGQ